VATVEPAGGDGGDEELGAVAVEGFISAPVRKWKRAPSVLDLRVGASVGHGEKAGASVLLHEVLVGELLAVDGLATGALHTVRFHCEEQDQGVVWLTLPRVKSPPWSMNSGMMRWKEEPA